MALILLVARDPRGVCISVSKTPARAVSRETSLGSTSDFRPEISSTERLRCAYRFLRLFSRKWLLDG